MCACDKRCRCDAQTYRKVYYFGCVDEEAADVCWGEVSVNFEIGRCALPGSSQNILAWLYEVLLSYH
jgi:hypothetical protein